MTQEMKEKEQTVIIYNSLISRRTENCAHILT